MPGNKLSCNAPGFCRCERVDSVAGAYPSMLELPDGPDYCAYYEEGQETNIRGVRVRVDKEGAKVIPDSGKSN